MNLLLLPSVLVGLSLSSNIQSANYMHINQVNPPLPPALAPPWYEVIILLVWSVAP